jgi:aryl-alcohol dehydrogenase-like predicted oxidoreductase
VQRTAFGRTGLSVTGLGLGLAALGRPGYIDLGRDDDLGSGRDVASMERRAHEVLDAAYEAGVRYVDAARSYGRAEAFLASWLEASGLGPDDVTVGSKWGYTYTADWRTDADVHEVKDHSLATLRRQVGESRALLGGRLDLYQIHSATLESGVLEDEAVMHELGRLRDDGLVIGLSVSGPRQAETILRALEVDAAETNPFGAVQATWNVLEPSAGPALAEAHAAGWGVLVKEAMANGRLGPRGEGSHRTVLDTIANAHGTGADAVAIAAVLANPWADVALSGAVTPGQLRSNATALDLSLDEEARAQLEALAEAPEAYWRTRSELAWS